MSYDFTQLLIFYDTVIVGFFTLNCPCETINNGAYPRVILLQKYSKGLFDKEKFKSH
jgi:hypothetical protein